MMQTWAYSGHMKSNTTTSTPVSIIYAIADAILFVTVGAVYMGMLVVFSELLRTTTW